MTILPRLFISLFPLFLFASSVNFKSESSVYSDKLYFDIFEGKWKSLPSNEPLNRGIALSKSELYVSDSGIEFGFGYDISGLSKINRGFIQTWYYAQSDFDTLLKESDIGSKITDTKIYGKLNYAQYSRFFIRKVFAISNSEFKISANVLRGKQLQYMDVNGTNTPDRFVADLRYYYTDRNLVSHNYEDDKDYYGDGFGLDLEYRFSYKKFAFFAGVYNLFGFIDWKSITYMEYHFDSQTKYVGDDGYYHYRPFGVGKYVVDTTFHQKLPVFVKYAFEYKKELLKFGDNGLFSQGARFDELYVGYRGLKIGYVPQSKNMIYGIYTDSFSAEISNSLKKEHTRMIKISFEMKIKG